MLLFCYCSKKIQPSRHVSPTKQQHEWKPLTALSRVPSLAAIAKATSHPLRSGIACDIKRAAS
jgi:hypothetical protein